MVTRRSKQSLRHQRYEICYSLVDNFPGFDEGRDSLNFVHINAQTLFYEPNTGYRPLYERTQEYARQSQAGIWGLALEQRCQLADNANRIGQGSEECSNS